jgi:hypothetical protein
MKSITEFINENINESHTKLNVEDVVSSIEYVCDGDEWRLGPSITSRTGSFEQAVDAAGSLYDVLELHAMFGDLADDLDCDEDELMDFISDNENEITKELGFK